jgi:membrane-associated protease RseP (regulator of RpoE activity)
MFFRKTVENSFSLAVMGLALSGVAVGQVAVPGVGNGNVGSDVQVDVNAAANAAAPAVDAATSANVNANSNANTIPGAQINGGEAGVDAAARTNGQNINSEVQSNTNAGVDALQNRANVSQNSNTTVNANPFGATFDSSTTDRLIIQNLQPNSTASRLGLRTGDRIIGFNGQTYTDVNQFDRDLNQLNGNSEVPFIYERNGQRFTQRFRMSSSNGQQTYGEPNYGNQGWNGQAGNFGQISHSASRPIYGVSSHNGYTGDMHHGQGYVGVTGSGSGSYHGSACCGEPVHSQQCCSVQHHRGHYHRGHHHSGRRHRHCCR